MMTDLNGVEKTYLFAAVSNTDLTEGKGFNIMLAACTLEATARRYAQGKGVMGGNANVNKIAAYKINGAWHFAGQIISPTAADMNAQKIIDARNQAHDKAYKLGLTPEDIAALKS
jgi:hypothetical protein